MEINVKNYFLFYKMEEKFFIDLGELKRKYYSKSRELHPDFYSQDAEAKQEEILALAAFNNDAYETLRHDNERMEYILKQHDVIGKEGKNKLDQMLLMEMMDINEALMELQMDFYQSAFEKVISEIKAIESELYGEVEVAMRGYDQDKGVGRLEIIAKYYLKKKYLLRIKDNLDKFVDV